MNDYPESLGLAECFRLAPQTQAGTLRDETLPPLGDRILEFSRLFLPEVEAIKISS
jgi:hypothetical protein